MKSSPSIKLIRTIAEMEAFSEAANKKKKKVGLIPTLGGLHDGHLSLVKAAKRIKKRCDLIVVSIFVNPKQFGPHEDLGQYPRDLEGDLQKLEKLGGVAAVFAPDASEMFPQGYRSYVEVEDLTKRLCGRSRPWHFRGVTTVVLKLFNIIRPQIALFGEKDYQQVLVIRKMVMDLNLDVQIEQRPIIRDADGLALSTRNAYLTEEQRSDALSLNRALSMAEKLVIAGERNSSIIVSNMREVIRSHPKVDIDYIAICHPETLADLEGVEARTLIAVAARVGGTRLIDNYLLDLVALDRREKEKLRKKKAERSGKATSKKSKKKRVSS